MNFEAELQVVEKVWLNQNAQYNIFIFTLWWIYSKIINIPKVRRWGPFSMEKRANFPALFVWLFSRKMVPFFHEKEGPFSCSLCMVTFQEDGALFPWKRGPFFLLSLYGNFPGKLGPFSMVNTCPIKSNRKIHKIIDPMKT